MSTCQNCQTVFQIFPEDRAFYKKINVPDPTWCPDCRNMRRLAWRNERVLYMRPCDLCKKQTLSMYPPDALYTIYCRECWWSDAWDPSDCGIDLEVEKPVLPQFEDLMRRVPRIAVMTKKTENSEYCNEVESIKDSYLAVCTFFGERLYYTYWMGWGNDCVDCSFTLRSNFSYGCQDLQESNGCTYVMNSESMVDSKFCFDCRGCSNCFMSVGLRHKSYYIRNKPYTREEYLSLIAKYDFGSYETITNLKNEFAKIQRAMPRRFAWMSSAENCVGDYIYQSKDVYGGFDIFGQENTRYAYDAGDAKDCMDILQAGIKSDLMYEVHSAAWAHRVFFTNWSWRNMNCQYMDSCHDSQDLFACVGLRNKKYCILNRQYTKEEYAALRERVIRLMRSRGEYGTFFPMTISPHAYNETVAQQWNPLAREEVVARGWKWQDHLPGKYDPPTLGWDRVADSIKDVDKSIIKELLACRACGKNYRIVGPEFEFYKKQVIPIPRKCPDCRFYERFAMRNPRRLWHRQCQCGGRKSGVGDQTYVNTGQHVHGDTQCPNEFETPYAPERQEKVYCELCYQKEIL